MAIIYYPNRVYKGKVPAIDRVMAQRKLTSSSSASNLAANSISTTISSNVDWQVDSVSFNFNNVTAKSYSFSIADGRNIVQNLNDYLWFQITGSLPQIITLTPGFYSGTTLATELQTRLNAPTLLNGNTNAFYLTGVIFSVSYDNILGVFVITPSVGQIRYLNVNTAQVLPLRDSIAGHVIGLTADSSFGANVTSDTSVPGLDSVLPVVSTVDVTTTTHYHDTVHTLSMDQAVVLAANSSSSVLASVMAVYEPLV